MAYDWEILFSLKCILENAASIQIILVSFIGAQLFNQGVEDVTLALLHDSDEVSIA